MGGPARRRYDRSVPDWLQAAMTTHEIIDAARAKLEPDVWDYIAGAAETETTARRNRVAIDSLALRPRVGRDVENVDPSSSLLGHRLRIPVVLAPIGACEAITIDGGIAQARAAERFGIVPAISSVTATTTARIASGRSGGRSGCCSRAQAAICSNSERNRSYWRSRWATARCPAAGSSTK